MTILNSFTTKVLITVFFLSGIAASWGDTITLGGTIRDFNDTHPNFESAIGGLEPGAVMTGLGVDGKPVFGAGGVAFTTAADFDQWYNDVPGVNLSGALPHYITLDNGGSGDIYSFTNNSFFPIDNKLLGNQGRSHNYHFTFEISTTFTYQTGQNFTFTGDDDLWVFINDTLVIDLGGVHSLATQSVDLDTLGLTVGNDYDFDLFFAERHTSQSNFSIETSILLDSHQVIPEPSTFVLLGLGLTALGYRRRKTA
jgi:fibro-slime domain-containing protein